MKALKFICLKVDCNTNAYCRGVSFPLLLPQLSVDPNDVVVVHLHYFSNTSSWAGSLFNDKEFLWCVCDIDNRHESSIRVNMVINNQDLC